MTFTGMPLPLLILAIAFAVLATAEWRRLPAIARIYLAVATAFGIGAVIHPGMTVTEAVDGTRDGIAFVVAVARVTGFAAVMFSVATGLRSLALR